MTLVGIETSTRVCGVGIANENGLSVERFLEEAHIHSEKLLTLLADVLKDAKIEIERIDAVAVSIGPGAFTGLRIGLSTAKGVCYALDKPLVLVPTFESVAVAAMRKHAGVQMIDILLDAKRGDWYSGRFTVDRGRLRQTRAVCVLSDQRLELPNHGTGETLVLADKVEEVSRKLVRGVRCEDVHQYCRPSIVALLGLEKLLRGEVADLPSVEPMYLRDFVVKAPLRS